jgi:hypothetical protein
MTCCVCGAHAGLHDQHWNRDTGYGICPRCAAQEAGTTTPDDMRSRYGEPGVNYTRAQVSHYGLWYWVLATFKEADNDQANAFMERTPGACLLTIQDGIAYIVHKDVTGHAQIQ